MQGSNDGITSPNNGSGCQNIAYPANWQSSGGGGYEGGGRVNYTVGSGSTTVATRCGITGGHSGRGGSGFVAAGNRFQSIEFTPEISGGNNNTVNVAPRHGADTDQTNTTGQPRPAVPIGQAGNRSNLVYSSNVNGGGDGRIVVYWVVAAPRVGVQKITPNGVGGPFSFADTNLTGAVANITTTAANTATPDLATATVNALPVTTPGANVTLTESAPANFNPVGVTCNDNNSANTGNTNPVATSANGSVTIPAAATAGLQADIICVFTNTVPADLQLTKTNTPGINGNVDQVSDTVVSGRSTTYQIRVFNAGPGVATNALVRDTPTTGLDCPVGNPVTITGDGVPAGSFTIGNLTGTGIALGTLASGQTAVLSFTCSVL
ncbi:hypothetical protein C9I47_0988 [Lysobacter maris]|uniref:Uncharacterized protein n=2 Tax=Marilutibacter maris TaxID=1605891 RepID=A0A2U9T668_9GAMM|nr:hypothetical protein C9I47_0988 [Lysobacter maris]